MEIKRICKTCKKELGLLEIYGIPVHIEATAGFPMPSGGSDAYCEKCYNDAVGETTLREEKQVNISEKDRLNKIKNLREKSSEYSSINSLNNRENTTILGIVVNKVREENFSKEGKSIKLTKLKVKDDTGTILLTLWNEQINEITIGKAYLIKGYVREFSSQKQITLGKYGVIVDLDID